MSLLSSIRYEPYVPSSMSRLPTISFPASTPPQTREAAAPGKPFRSRIGAMSFVVAIETLTTVRTTSRAPERLAYRGVDGAGFQIVELLWVRREVQGRKQRSSPCNERYRQVPMRSEGGQSSIIDIPSIHGHLFASARLSRNRKEADSPGN